MRMAVSSTCSQRHWRTLKGFTLLEISIVLSIVGVLLGGTLALVTSYLQQSPTRDTVQQMRAIDEALWNFRATYGRLPCPADITLAATSNGFGKEATDMGTCAVAANGSNFATGYGAAGMIPTKTLGLSDDMAYDSWGRRIFYAIDIRYTKERAFVNDLTKTITGAAQTNPVVITSASHGFSDGELVYIANVAGMTELNSTYYKVASSATNTFALQTPAGTNVDGSAYTTYTLDGTVSHVGALKIQDSNGTTFAYAVYALWSTGENGHGAYPKTGGTLRFNSGSTNTKELENCDCGSGTGISGTFNLDFVQGNFTRNASTGTDQFDDILMFKTRPQMGLPY